MKSLADLKQHINSYGPLILDGGLATDLEAHGATLQGDPLWSARLLHTQPQAIKESHYRFLQSGADVVTTATYQASLSGFTSHLGLSAEDARELLMSAVHLARDAVRTFVSDGLSTMSEKRYFLVAGSIGPYGAFLCNGSEYTGDYANNMSLEELRSWHRPQVECVAAAGADVIAFETIPSIKEGEALVELLREFPDTKAWLSFSCKDGKHISDGSLFTDAVQIAQRSKQVIAVGVNCCAPGLVESLLDSAKSIKDPDTQWVVYPNSGEEWDRKQGWKTSGRQSITDLSQTWLEQGATMVGGCCRISPAHISELRQALKGKSSGP
ncbi:homocysteine S-methyltransferase YbgG isoform X1 [Synchiropus splendidus]|uniref:homocysteine S-methyltransferase YbgG isoform X1 n=1 Tax=Synchiropus splendidus TaxID=270530 RepID=UPI00237DD5AA|nr:homocysteine S-methyltransferase YbgG isoform X1 [Synchiropus splendidus]